MALLSYPFRPFFLLVPAFAVMATVVWIFALYGRAPTMLPANITYWHAHEMLIGFALGAVAGFVLTAVASWTGRPPVRGRPLLLLVLAWLAGRVAIFFGGLLPVQAVAVIDLLFPVVLLVLVAREILSAGNQRNYPIILILAALTGAVLLYHLGNTGMLPLAIEADRIGLYLFMHLLLVMITVIAGRIVPTFTANWLRASGSNRKPVSRELLDRTTIGATAVTGLYAAFIPNSLVTALLAIIAAALHAARLSGWCSLATVREPLLFVLHAAYAWFPVAYLLMAAAIFGWLVTPVEAMHALGLGVIAMMILAVTTRVALGHTGRPLHASRFIAVAYVLAALAVVFRLMTPSGANYFLWLLLSAVFWSVALILYLVVYAPVLLGPRVDGRPEASMRRP